jgi:hypothetical protein
VSRRPPAPLDRSASACRVGIPYEHTHPLVLVHNNTMKDDRYDSDSDDEVPPPPPHVILLKGAFINTVFQYLDVDSRKRAASSSRFFRDSYIDTMKTFATPIVANSKVVIDGVIDINEASDDDDSVEVMEEILLFDSTNIKRNDVLAFPRGIHTPLSFLSSSSIHEEEKIDSAPSTNPQYVMGDGLLFVQANGNSESEMHAKVPLMPLEEEQPIKVAPSFASSIESSVHDDGEIPFDERSKGFAYPPPTSVYQSFSEHNNDASSTDSNNEIPEDALRKAKADYLGQFTDAAIFGDTPQVFSELMNEIIGSAKYAAKFVVTEKQRHSIDDEGPIKIGDSYYTHREALQKWKKARDKLEDPSQNIPPEKLKRKLERAAMEAAVLMAEGKTWEIAARRAGHDMYKKEKKQAKKESSASNESKYDDSGSPVVAKRGVATSSEESVLTIDELINRFSLFGVHPDYVDSDDEVREYEPLPSSSKSSKSSTDSTHSKTSSSEEGADLPLPRRPVRVTKEAKAVVSTDVSAKAAKGAVPKKQDAQTPPTERVSANNTKSFKLRRNAASKKTRPVHVTPDKSLIDEESTVGNDGKFILSDSVLGQHFGLEVTSIKDTRKKDFESTLGSQYGTEVLFTPKKVVTARKPRTLTTHNMNIKPAPKVQAAKLVTSAPSATAGKKPKKSQFPLKLKFIKKSKA